MGVARLLRGRYGSEPEIDIENQYARVRVVKPVTFDFAGLHEGMKRNNFDVGDIRLRATVVVADGKATIRPTGQVFHLRNEAPEDAGPAVRWLRVHDWKEPDRLQAELIEGP